MNKCFPELAAQKEPSGDTAPWRAFRYAKARGDREAEAAAALRGARKIPFFFPEPEAPPLYRRVSEALA